MTDDDRHDVSSTAWIEDDAARANAEVVARLRILQIKQGVRRGEAYLAETYGHLLEAKESAATPAMTGPSRKYVGWGMPIADVILAAEEHVRANGWPGRNSLADLVGCARSQITKAAKASRYLRARKAEHEAEKRGPGRRVPLTDDHLIANGELARLTAEQEDDRLRDDRQAARFAKGRR